MRKIFQATILSFIFAFSFYGFVFGTTIPSSDAYPCGTDTAPLDTISPADVRVKSVSGAATYQWYVDKSAQGPPTKQNFAELTFPTTGTHSWTVSVYDSKGALLAVSDDFCYVNITSTLCNDPTKATCIKNPLSSNNFTDLFDTTMNFIFTLSFPITAAMVVIAGFLFVTGGGDPIKLKRARDILLWTAIGFSVILVSKGFPFLIRDILGVK